MAHVVTLLLLGCQPSTALPPGDPARPDVVLVSIDSLRPDHLGSYGNVRHPSPFLDSLAAAGARFTEARSSSPWTLPSHVTMLSGRGPLTHTVIEDDRHIPAGLPLVQEAFSAAGYATAGLVSTIYVSGMYGFDRGFQLFNDHGINRKSNLEHSVRAATVVDEALAWAHEQAAGKPIFLFVHLYDVHYPYLPPEPYNYEYDKPGTKKSTRYAKYEHYLRHPVEAERWTHLLAQYDESLHYVDDQLARLHQGWSARPATWVVTADHGEELGERGSWGHAHTLFPEVMRVPLIVSGARVPGESVRADRVGTIDVAATVAALGGVAFPSEGVDVMGAVPADRDFVFETSRFQSARLGLLHGNMRVDLDLAHGTSTQYDESQDPEEHTPLPSVDPALLGAAWSAVGKHWTTALGVVTTGWAYDGTGDPHHGIPSAASFALFPPDAPFTSGEAARDVPLAPTVTLDAGTRAELEALGYEQ